LKLGELINVSDSANPIPYYANSMALAPSVAGGAEKVVPSIQTGSLDITDDVTLTYKVK
jgi:uncharacterized protein YggE